MGTGFAVVAVWLGVVSAASAAFPGRNGLLAVQPLRGNGIVLVGVDGRGQRRICTKVRVCGRPVRPQFSPDGRSIVFGGPAVRLIGTDGSCQNCRFGRARNPAFLPGGALVSFVTGGGLVVDGIDGLRAGSLLRLATDAVWSASGRLAVADRDGRVLADGSGGSLRLIGDGSLPSWSPDGTRLAFVRRGWIVVVRASGHAVRRLVRGSAPAFSPDGRWLAFVGPDRRIQVIRASGGQPLPVGHSRGLAVDWQPLPATPTTCVAPPGSHLIASSREGAVTSHEEPSRGGDFYPGVAVMGCLRSDGRERLLEGLPSFISAEGGSTDTFLAATSGEYAAVVDLNGGYKGSGTYDSTTVFDLWTGLGLGSAARSEARSTKW